MKGLFAAAAALIFAGATAHADVKIGSVLSVTGPASFLGDPEKRTLEMYVADINAAGGINGQRVKVFIYDDGGDANKARTFATRLVEEDKVDAVVGGSITGTSLAMRAECLKMAPAAGVTVLKDEAYGATDSDMTPQLTNIKNTDGIQALINCGFGQGPAIVTRNYRQLGIAAPLYESHGVSSKSYIDLAGQAAEGVRLPASADRK